MTNTFIDNIIQTYEETKNIPHILIYGQHNSGKKKMKLLKKM